MFVPCISEVRRSKRLWRFFVKFTVEKRPKCSKSCNFRNIDVPLVFKDFPNTRATVCFLDFLSFEVFQNIVCSGYFKSMVIVPHMKPKSSVRFMRGRIVQYCLHATFLFAVDLPRKYDIRSIILLALVWKNSFAKLNASTKNNVSSGRRRYRLLFLWPNSNYCKY